MSWSKEKMADHISSHVISFPEEMVAMLDDEEIVLAHEMIAAGKQTVIWKRHLLKYHHLKKMAWVVVNRKSRGKDGFVMPSRTGALSNGTSLSLSIKPKSQPHSKKPSCLIKSEQYPRACSHLFRMCMNISATSNIKKPYH